VFPQERVYAQTWWEKEINQATAGTSSVPSPTLVLEASLLDHQGSHFMQEQMAASNHHPGGLNGQGILHPPSTKRAGPPRLESLDRASLAFNIDVLTCEGKEASPLGAPFHYSPTGYDHAHDGVDVSLLTELSLSPVGSSAPPLLHEGHIAKMSSAWASGSLRSPHASDVVVLRTDQEQGEMEASGIRVLGVDVLQPVLSYLLKPRDLVMSALVNR
jgi:hypothetical protein